MANQIEISVCINASGIFDATIRDCTTGEEITLSGNQKIDGKQFELIDRIAPGCIFTRYERVNTTDQQPPIAEPVGRNSFGDIVERLAAVEANSHPPVDWTTILDSIKTRLSALENMPNRYRMTRAEVAERGGKKFADSMEYEESSPTPAGAASLFFQGVKHVYETQVLEARFSRPLSVPEVLQFNEAIRETTCLINLAAPIGKGDEE